jgi:hypothetical protein
MPCQKKHIPTPRRYAFICLVWLSMTMPGCKVSDVRNPSFDLSVSRAKEELRQMRRQPVTLARPVVVIGGWGDVMGVAPAYIAEQLRKAIGDDRIIARRRRCDVR